MNIFSLLVLSLLFNSLPSDATKLRAKRSIKDAFGKTVASSVSATSEISVDETTVGFVTENDTEEVSVKKSKSSPNATSSIFKLPHDILAQIGTFLQNPYLSLSPVSYDFWMAMKSFPPAFVLQSRTLFPNFDKISQSEELLRLLKFDSAFLNSRIDNLFFPGSVFVPMSPVTTEYSAKTIISRITSSPDKLKAISSLMKHLMVTQNFDSIIALLVSIPELKLDTNYSSDFLKNFFTHIFAKKNYFETFLILKAGFHDLLPFFITLAGFPIDLETFNRLVQPVPYNGEIFLSAFAASCALSLPLTLSEEQETLIKARNIEIINNFTGVNDISKQFALLCNELRYSKTRLADHISKEFLVSFYASFPANSRNKIKFYNEVLVVIALLKGYKGIFLQIIRSSKMALNSHELCKLLQKSPEFIDLLSPTQFKKIYGVRNQILFLETGKLKQEDVYKISNLYERIRVYSSFLEPDEFRRKLRLIYMNCPFSIPFLIQKIVKESPQNSPAVVYHILDTFKTIKLSTSDIGKIATHLGNPKYLQALLESSPEMNIWPFDDNVNKFYIHINGLNFMEILKLAPLLKQERARVLREKCVVKWINLFLKNHLRPEDLIKFFDIFGLEVGNFNVTDVSFEAIDLFIKDSRQLFNNPELFGANMDSFLVLIAEIVDQEDSKTNHWMKLDPFNPLLRKSYAIYQLWMERNLKSFVKNAKKSILKAFQPKISANLLKELMLEEDVFVGAISRIFSVLIPRDQQVEIELTSIHDLRIFFYNNLPKLGEILNRNSNFTVDIYWINIIEDSRTVIDYEVILSVISRSELSNLMRMGDLDPSSINAEFRNYCLATWEGREFPELNRNILQ